MRWRIMRSTIKTLAISVITNSSHRRRRRQRETDMGGPSIRRGESSGDIWTPQIFIDAVERNWGPLAVDLAATAESTKAPSYFDEGCNSLTRNWHLLAGNL